MDDSEGNLYKGLYIQDHTAAINVRLTAASDFAVGDSVRISLLGSTLSEYAGVIQLDGIDPATDIILQSKDNDLTPDDVNLIDLTYADEGKLVRVNNIQFINPELTLTFADAINQTSESRTLESCDTGSMLVRTSGFANFAGEPLPVGKGSLVCIVGRYNSDLQLLVRDYDEVAMVGTRCAGLLFTKDFDDDAISSGGWLSVVVTGTFNWSTSTAGGAATPYAVMSNWNGTDNDPAEVWLISPAIDNTAGLASIVFNNACNYSGDPLSLVASEDYAGVGDPTLATWTDLTSAASWSTGSWSWAGSGENMLGLTGSTVYVAFKYVGSASDGKTWEIDDIVIKG